MALGPFESEREILLVTFLNEISSQFTPNYCSSAWGVSLWKRHKIRLIMSKNTYA